MTQFSVEHIELDASGVARLVGRRMKVMQLALYKRTGMSAEEIQAAHPFLSLAEIHAALAYYYDHQTLLDQQIDESKQLVEELRTKTEDPLLAEKLRQHAKRT